MSTSLKDRLTAATVARLCAAGLFLIVGVVTGFVFSSLLTAVLFALVACCIAGNALVDSDDFGGWGGWIEFALDLTILASAGFLVVNLQSGISTANKNLERWGVLNTRKAPAPMEGKLPFPDELYSQVSRPEANKLVLPRYADGTRWLLRLTDKIVELVPGERDGYKIEEDVDKLIVTGTFPDGARLYFINIDLAPSASKDIPKVVK